MPNHWHLLLRPRRDGELPRWMQWLTVTHTHRWHMHHHTAGTGPVYQGRFRSFPVQSDEHFLKVARYIERNALRAKLCKPPKAESWRWGSLGLRRGGGLTQEERALSGLMSDWPVDRPRNWVRRVNQAETAVELKAMRSSVQRGTPFGAEDWVRRTVAKLELQSTMHPRGRPKKGNNSS